MAAARFRVVIEVLDGPVFHLRTDRLSVVLAVGAAGHLELLWIGDPLEGADVDALRMRWPNIPGMVLAHGSMADSGVTLGRSPLAWSSAGKGDFRAPGISVQDRGVLDFVYASHRVVDGVLPAQGLPAAEAEPDTQTVEVTLADAVAGLECVLRWSVFPLSGVVTRRTIVRNVGASEVVLDGAASLLVDLPDLSFDLITLDGWWTSEARASRRPLAPGRVVNESRTGSSNSSHNPGLLLVAGDATETAGRCFGFNLLYSGSHATSIERGQWGTVRVVSGLQPDGFAWPLAAGEQFTTPEAVLAYSNEGLTGLSDAMHAFVSGCVVPAHWRDRERPVVYNHWEATYFDYDLTRLVEIAGDAARMGCETFVLDDGWFGARNDDRSSLGDWTVNEDKLPGGLARLGSELAALGMGLGLWFEPESVSRDSDLFRAHPEWVIADEGRTPSEGRHQLLLDLTQEAVRDHLVERVSAVIDEAGASFVKWDMNRLIADADSPGFHHRYMLGLYDVLTRIFGPRPHVLLETCSSGGNRFDLGVLAVGPQIWASDCTDPFERLEIQHGLSYLYPRSTISAHVSASPNHQTGRSSSVDFRFAVSAPYPFGIELDPATLTDEEIGLLAERVGWYKEHRALLQFGELRRGDVGGAAGEGLRQLSVTDGASSVAFRYAARPRTNDWNGLWRVAGLPAGPVRLTPAFGGDAFTVPGAALAQGVQPPHLYEGQAAVVLLKALGRAILGPAQGSNGYFRRASATASRRRE